MERIARPPSLITLSGAVLRREPKLIYLDVLVRDFCLLVDPERRILGGFCRDLQREIVLFSAQRSPALSTPRRMVALAKLKAQILNLLRESFHDDAKGIINVARDREILNPEQQLKDEIKIRRDFRALNQTSKCPDCLKTRKAIPLRFERDGHCRNAKLHFLTRDYLSSLCDLMDSSFAG
jgi:hypothetical protein